MWCKGGGRKRKAKKTDVVAVVKTTVFDLNERDGSVNRTRRKLQLGLIHPNTRDKKNKK